MSSRRFKVLPSTAPSSDTFDDQTHERVAQTLLEVMTAPEAMGLAVGLEGTWGSGKSTVVSILKCKLASVGQFGFSYFDAWSHEGDPLRRVFLESLIDQIGDGNPKIARFRQRLARQRKSSRLTTNQHATKLGKLLALGAFFVPLGLAIVGAQTRANGLVLFHPELPVDWTLVAGFGLTLFPPLVLLGNLVARTLGWLANEESGIFDPAGWLFLQNDATQTRQEISSSIERSSIEFERYFDEVLTAYFTDHKGFRLVIVVDNLDRISAPDALKIWSTLQTFLQERSPAKSAHPLYRNLWVLVPYDPDNLATIFSGTEAGDADADRQHSFFDKSFQLRLDVPSLVPSGWESFLRQCVDVALHTWSPDERRDVMQVFSLARRDASDAASPRQIKTFVNQVGLVAQNAHESVSIAGIAYYVFLRYIDHLSSKELKDRLLKSRLPTKEMPTFDANLRDDLCGLVFGVDPQKGIQLLLEPAITGALNSRNGESLKVLARDHGSAFWLAFGFVVQRITESMPWAEHASAVAGWVGHHFDERLESFEKKIARFADDQKSVQFPKLDESLDSTCAILTVLEWRGEASARYWHKLMEALAIYARVGSVESASLARRIEALRRTITTFEPQSLEVGPMELEFWINWSRIPQETRRLIRPHPGVLSDFLEVLNSGNPIPSGASELLGYFKELDLQYLPDTRTVLFHLFRRVAGTGSAGGITEEHFQILNWLVFESFADTQGFLGSWEPYHVASLTGTANRLAIGVGVAFSSALSSLIVAQAGSSVAGLNAVVRFWANDDSDNATEVWNQAVLHDTYRFIWDLAADSRWHLLKSVFALAIETRRVRFFVGVNPLEGMRAFSQHFAADAPEARAFVGLLVANTSMDTLVHALERLPLFSKEALWLLELDPNRTLGPLAEIRVASITSEEWVSSLTGDNDVCRLAVELRRGNPSFVLGVGLRDGLSSFLADLLVGNHEYPTSNLEILRSLLNLLPTAFRQQAGKFVGQRIVENRFETKPDWYQLLEGVISFESLLDTHGSEFEAALDNLTKSSDRFLLSLLGRFVDENHDARYKAKTMYRDVLDLPLRALYSGSDKSTNEDVTRLANFLGIELASDAKKT